MKHAQKSIKSSKISIILVLIAMFVASIFCFTFKPVQLTNNLYATIADEPTTTLKDPNFNSSQSSNYPYQPSSSNYETSSTIANNHVTAGIINLDNSKYNSIYPTNPNTSTEQRVLMISSGVESTTTEGDQATTKTEYADVKFGYTTTDNQINIEADSNYVLSVDVLTLDVDNYGGVGALYLYDNNDNDAIIAKIENIDTVLSRNENTPALSKTQWQRYYFLISTNSISTYNLKLGMFLNGKGTVLFDNLSLVKTSDDKLTDLKNSLSTNNYVSIDKDTTNLVKTYSVQNGLDFDTEGSCEKSYTTTEPDGTVESALHLVANSSNVKLTMKETISFKKNLAYKVTAYVKASSVSSTSLNLVEKDAEDGKDANIAITSTSTTQNPKNDYVAYSFYVLSNARKDTYYNLVLSVGGIDGSSTGSADLYLSRVVVELCNYDNYNNSSTNSTKLNLVTRTLSSDYLTNGDFDIIEIEDYSTPYPAKPNGWTVKDESNGDGKVIHGVINNSQIAELTAQGNLPDPLIASIPQSPVNTNMLMLYTNLQKELAYTSPVIKCTAGNYYKFSANVLASHSNANFSLITYNDGQEVVLVSKTITTADYDKYFKYSSPASLYLYTGNQDLDVYLKISTKAQDGVAVAFLDEAKSTTTTEAVFNSQAAGNKASLTFAIDENNFATGSANYSIVDIITLDDVDVKLLDANSNKVLSIFANEPTSYKTKSLSGFSLSASNYYKLTFSIYTKDLTWDDQDGTVDANTVGASFGLTNFEQFNAVKSVNGWTTYTFYIHPSSDTTSYVTISFGSEDVKVQGTLYIANINLSIIEEDMFNKIETNNTTMKLTTVQNEDEKEEPDENEQQPKQPFNWNNLLYFVTSALTAIALIVAVVGVATKKFKRKKPAKKTKNSYDRVKTVSKQVSSREANMIREARIAELNKELNLLLAERSEYEQQYKQDLTKLREMKISRAPANEINNLNKDLKKNQKKTSVIGINISKLENEIEYTKSNMYLSSLIKKLERERSTVEVVETEEHVIEQTQPGETQKLETKPAKTTEAKKHTANATTKKTSTSTTKKTTNNKISSKSTSSKSTKTAKK